MNVYNVRQAWKRLKVLRVSAPSLGPVAVILLTVVAAVWPTFDPQWCYKTAYFAAIGSLAFVAVIGFEYAFRKQDERDRETIRLLTDLNSKYAENYKPTPSPEAIQGTAATAQGHQVIEATLAVAAKPKPSIIDFGEMGTFPRPPDPGKPTYAGSIVNALPKPKNFRQEVLDLVNVGRELVRDYHGSLDVDSFVHPEISAVLSQRLIAARRRLERLLHRQVARKDALFPVTVRRMAMLLEDLESAATELPGDIPPS